MNKQLLVDVRPFDISTDKINESISENNGKLIVKGVLQRAESKNQNGRVDLARSRFVKSRSR